MQIRRIYKMRNLSLNKTKKCNKMCTFFNLERLEIAFRDSEKLSNLRSERLENADFSQNII